MIEQLRNPSAWIEVLVLAVAYYAVLTFIRGTRGAPILKALVALFVVAFLGAMAVSDALGLVHIKTLLQYLLSGSALALVVIFGPELRRALQHLAQSPLLSPLLRDSSSSVLNELADAAVKLSKNRIGALVALEREVGLNEYVENGCKIDAALTSELLETIFYPGSALHDGAVVVRRDRVAAAGCLFPLTDDMSLSKSMGTRHRAAIGISEETDAVAVVVSEETGRISVAVGGKVTYDLNREQLVKLLDELLSRRKGEDPAEGAAPQPPKAPSGPAPSNGNGHPAPFGDRGTEIGRAREEAKQ